MREAASQVLSERARDDDGLRQKLAISVGAHVVALVILLVGPGSWFGSTDSEVVSVMTIRLGGAEGPGEGGLTPLGAQPIQQVISLPEARRPQWVQPPADTAPEVIVPVEEAPRVEPESEVNTAPEEARGRQLTRGPQLQDGLAMADTGGRGLGVGLSAGGLGGSGGEISLSDFCCPEYVATMLSLIERHYDPIQRVTGSAAVRFTIRSSGAIDTADVQILRSSGHLALDQSSRRAVLMTRQLPPLPSQYTEDSLTINLVFEYRRP